MKNRARGVDFSNVAALPAARFCASAYRLRRQRRPAARISQRASLENTTSEALQLPISSNEYSRRSTTARIPAHSFRRRLLIAERARIALDSEKLSNWGLVIFFPMAFTPSGSEVVLPHSIVGCKRKKEARSFVVDGIHR